MTTMIEKVSRALAAHAWRRGSENDPNFMRVMYPGGEADYVASQSKVYLEDARSAIGAMREPTDEVCRIAREEGGFLDRTSYRALIDAALKEAP